MSILSASVLNKNKANSYNPSSPLTSCANGYKRFQKVDVCVTQNRNAHGSNVLQNEYEQAQCEPGSTAGSDCVSVYITKTKLGVGRISKLTSYGLVSLHCKYSIVYKGTNTAAQQFIKFHIILLLEQSMKAPSLFLLMNKAENYFPSPKCFILKHAL